MMRHGDRYHHLRSRRLRPIKLRKVELKTWLKGTHHGVSSKHLPHYINEFVFRFNRRRMPMAAFQSLLGLTAQRAPTTYKM